MFLVALDNPMPEHNGSRRSMASKQFIHGGGSRGNSANRWFDKTVQVIMLLEFVFLNGTAKCLVGQDHYNWPQ